MMLRPAHALNGSRGLAGALGQPSKTWIRVALTRPETQ